MHFYLDEIVDAGGQGRAPAEVGRIAPGDIFQYGAGVAEAHAQMVQQADVTQNYPAVAVAAPAVIEPDMRVGFAEVQGIDGRTAAGYRPDPAAENLEAAAAGGLFGPG